MSVSKKTKSDPKLLLLKSNLKQLRLPTMNAEFEKLAREAASSNQTFEQYLLQLSEPDQTGSVPDGKGLGGLRFLSDQIDQQTESIGTVPLRMGTSRFQCLSAWAAGNWENAFIDWIEVVVSFYMRVSQ